MLVQRFLNTLSDLCKLDEPKEILARLENTRTLFKASKKHITGMAFFYSESSELCGTTAMQIWKDFENNWKNIFFTDIRFEVQVRFSSPLFVILNTKTKMVLCGIP